MPDIGVPWPEIGKAPPEEQSAQDTAVDEGAITDTASEHFYAITIAGLERIGNSADLVQSFQKQSDLYEGRKEEANAAQIQRRAEDDSELIAELLRSQGYYDAFVEPVIEPEGNVLRVTLEAQPGEQYRFQSVELPGIEAAGPDSEKLRQSLSLIHI